MSVVSFFLVILGSILALNLVWWVSATRLTRRNAWRHVTTGFIIFQVAALAFVIFGRISQSGWDRILPKVVVTALLIWHMIVLPVTIVVLVLSLPFALAIF